MRVGYGCQLLRGSAFGVTNCIRGLAEALVETAGPEDELVVYAPRPIASIRARHVQSPRYTALRGGRILWEQLVLPWRASRDGIDAYHAPGYVLPLAMRAPTVLSVYDLIALRRPEFCTRSNRLHYRLVLPPSIRRARCVVVPSRTVRGQLLESFRLPLDRVVVVPPGIDDLFREAPDDERVAAVRRR